MVTHKSNKQVSEDFLLNLYLEARNQDPKSEDVSESMYVMCLTLKMLENSGNKFPSQEEIDNLEKILKRFNRKKSVKISIKKKIDIFMQKKILPHAA